MKQVPQQFEKNGYSYKMCGRIGMVALYTQSLGTRLLALEVVVISEVPETVMKIKGQPAKTIAAHERYPSDGDWGRTGWTFSLFGGEVSEAKALAEASLKMDELISRETLKTA